MDLVSLALSNSNHFGKMAVGVRVFGKMIVGVDMSFVAHDLYYVPRVREPSHFYSQFENFVTCGRTTKTKPNGNTFHWLNTSVESLDISKSLMETATYYTMSPTTHTTYGSMCTLS